MLNSTEYKNDIVEFFNVLSEEECNQLINYFNSDESQWQVTCFYGSRVMDPYINLNDSSHITREYLDNLRIKFKDIAFNVCKKDLKNLSLSAHKWDIGAYADHHSDNTELDGTPNAWQDNKFVTIVYLNDNYDGGNLLFKDHNLSISPKQGSVVAFDPGFHNLHGVSEIKTGTRYTMLASFDYTDSIYDRDLLEWRKEYSIEQEEQRKNWDSLNQ